MADVVVIGGGIAGCATAYYLAADGVSVLLLEQADLNTFASGSNAGSLHAQIPHEPFAQLGESWARAFAPALRLFSESLRIWERAEEVLGTDLEVRMTGGLLVASSPEELRQIERKAEIERAVGLQIELLDRAALRQLAPYVSERMLGGAFCAREGKANPLIAAPAFARAAQRCGAVVRLRTRVTGLRRCGSCYEIELPEGVIQAKVVVNAAGAEAGTLAQMLGVSLPVQGFPIQVSVTEPVEPLVSHLVYYAREKLTLKQTLLGTILIGGGWPARQDAWGRPVADPRSLATNLQVALEVVPRLAPVNVVRTWAAIVNGTEDWRPLLGEVPGLPGFFLCYVPWMGFTAGPAAGRIVASLIQQRTPPLDVDYLAFAPS